MDNTAELQQARARKLYLLNELTKIDSEINDLYLLSDEHILTGDFDGDGIVSIIDTQIIMDILVGANHSSLYDRENNTFNGKSLDLNGNEGVDIGDAVTLVNNTLNYLKANIPIDINIGMKQYNDKPGFSTLDFIRSYCNSHDGEYPTLDELKAAYNAA